jgi:hypothetical protein
MENPPPPKNGGSENNPSRLSGQDHEDADGGGADDSSPGDSAGDDSVHNEPDFEEDETLRFSPDEDNTNAKGHAAENAHSILDPDVLADVPIVARRPRYITPLVRFSLCSGLDARWPAVLTHAQKETRPSSA